MPVKEFIKRGKTSRSTSHVLVVGGSFSGICAAETLLGARTPMTVTLVSRSNYFEFLPAAYRCLVHPNDLEAVTTPLTGRPFKFIHGTIVSIGRFEAKVQLHGENAEGEEQETTKIEFDFCIWATGIGYPEPLYSTSRFLKQRKKCFDASRMDILNAKSILVVGGGPVGVELAAELSEIPTASNQKSITLATKAFELMKGLPEKARWYAEMWLRNKGIRVITASNVQTCDEGETLLMNTDGVAPTVYKGADLVLWATGNRHGQTTQPLLVGGLVANEDLDLKGRVWVRSTLQLPRARHFFACGDCAVVACDRQRDLISKTAYAAMEAGRLAARNVMLLDAAIRKTVSLTIQQLQRYPEHAFPLGTFPQVFCISLGATDGIMCVGPLVITGNMAVFAKKTIEKLNVRAFSGDWFSMFIFTLIERVLFFLAAIVQSLFNCNYPTD